MQFIHEIAIIFLCLTRQDWRHIKGRPWGDGSNGYWMLYVANSGKYDVRLRFHSNPSSGEALLEIGGKIFKKLFLKTQISNTK